MANKIVKSKSSIKLTVEVIIKKEDDYYVAYCPAIELSAYADTIEKAKSSFEKEIEIFLDETHKRGTLEKYLLKNGWRLQQTPELNYEPPRQSLDKISSLMKGIEKIVNQEIIIPVY